MSYSICLKGFSDNEATRVTQILAQMGHRTVRSLQAAQLVVTGPDASRDIYQQAQSRGMKMLSWEEFRRSEGANNADDAQVETPPLESQKPLPLIEEVDGRLRILDLWFAKRQDSGFEQFKKLIPGSERFQHICVDQPFIDTLRAVCLGANYDLAVALEGDTSASKTTAIQWLACQLEQPILRLNLNGQTDIGEIIGRYVPSSATSIASMADLYEVESHFSPRMRKMLQQARQEGRDLIPMEVLLLAGRERLATTNWEFLEGGLTKAARHGWWTLLDEINLAEPAVLERLNSVLESPRTMVISEGGGTVFGPGGDVPFHEHFRLFATLNPAEYSGRNILSQAFRDRWSIWHQAATAGETDYLAMINHLVSGEHPVVHSNGIAYQAPPTPPLYESLQFMPDWDILARRLAMFHFAVVKAAGTDSTPATLGRSRRERYTFTRRALLNTLNVVNQQIGSGRVPNRLLLRDAIEIFYIKRLRDTADRNAINSLMRAADL
ncbi:MAG: AAA family ATPase [Verrucomicrobiaceae bacterium]